jgi:hypothetical protein
VETTLLSRWAERAPAEIDLADERQEALLRQIAEEMLDEFADADALVRLDEQLAAHDPDPPVLVRLAVKLALSRSLVAALGGGFHLSLVFALYKEHNRLRTRAEHPHGENLLLRKIDQIDWLLADAPGSSWDMIAVDDGCPEGSGHVAERILEAHAAGDDVRVLFLERAIAAGHPAAVGSRRAPTSVAVKSGARDARGKLFIYLWKHLIPELGPIVDTQCGFKAFRADLVGRIAADAIEKRFAFDIELLLRTERARTCRSRRRRASSPASSRPSTRPPGSGW